LPRHNRSQSEGQETHYLDTTVPNQRYITWKYRARLRGTRDTGTFYCTCLAATATSTHGYCEHKQYSTLTRHTLQQPFRALGADKGDTFLDSRVHQMLVLKTNYLVARVPVTGTGTHSVVFWSQYFDGTFCCQCLPAVFRIRNDLSRIPDPDPNIFIPDP
jgi:hypothetical protein